MSPKTYLGILKGGVIASLFTVFLVFTNLLFPYITSKQLSFNILIEVLLVFWVVLIWRYPEYRPKKNFITYGLIAYFAAVLASCFVSVDVLLSIWGDSERMLGFFHLLHFLIFYFILITAFRSKSDWNWLLSVSVFNAIIVSLIGLFGKNSYSTIGNTAYVSGYLIFNLYFLALLFWRSGALASARKWRWAMLLPAFIMLAEFKKADTSGAIIGLGFSILLLLLLLGLNSRRKSVKAASLSALALGVIISIFIFSNTDKAWFKNNGLLNGLTTQKATFQTRLISWRGAAADFKYHPIFGTGFGNYAIIFDKHFDPKFFDYTKTETYFDRAHNNLIDIVSTTGAVGLLTYLSIFVAIFYYLFLEYRRNRRGGEIAGERVNIEIILIISLVVAYFIQNLAVFDSLVTYIGLMITLGLIYSMVVKPETAPAVASASEKKRDWEWPLLIALMILMVIIIGRFNVRPWKSFASVIKGYAQIASNRDFESGFEIYRQAFSVNNPLDRDGKWTIINLATANPFVFASLSPDKANEVIDILIGWAKQESSYNPQDSLMQMQLAQILDTAARLNYENLDKFNYYSAQAVQAIDASIESSPGRVPTYLIKAQILGARGEKDEAIAAINKGIELNPNYSESYCRLAQFRIIFEEQEKMGDSLDKCVDLGGAETINSTNLLKVFLQYYDKKKDYKHGLPLAEQWVLVDNESADAWINLANFYLQNQDKEKAVLAAREAARLNPQYQSLLEVISGASK